MFLPGGGGGFLFSEKWEPSWEADQEVDPLPHKPELSPRPPTREQTDTCENITPPPLCKIMRSAKIYLDGHIIFLLNLSYLRIQELIANQY